MFFSIAARPQHNFSHFYKLGKLHLSTDAGWHELDQGHYRIVYKGYADEKQLTDLLSIIADQTNPELLGNFCAIVYDFEKDTIKIQTDRYRSFPIYFTKHKEVTNLVVQEKTAWTDSLLEIRNDLSIVESKFDVVGVIATTELSEGEVVKQINSILEQKICKFLSHNQLPIRAHISGGVDSLLVYSYLQKFDHTHELIKYLHIDYDKFWLQNSGTLTKFWGYKQIHHWTDPCVLTSGAPGDEFMLRSPTTTDLYLKAHNLEMLTLLEDPKWKNSLHYTYFNKTAHQKIFKTQSVDLAQTQVQLFWHLCNIVVNDWQHWHIGQTLTWTPLRDLEIFKLLLRLPLDSALGQILDSSISRQLIEQNKFGLSAAISDQKNIGNVMKNLVGILF